MTKGDLINKIYDILIEICGADPTGRLSFIDAMSNPSGMPEEYNFGGILGAGGKIWPKTLMVSCYKSDLNQERKKIIVKANARLMELNDRRRL